ncbi:MAG: hypothetical protein KF794_02265 [Xanthobacteraceae bacterium]|nr:hypothetical protein [Xanthobacteraceae bacterium]QYK45550.1 MAG: hypothetical protein KF794_02265 [Xanthobacteraceae bacterium]HMN51284.1 hypothetical protein [Xanthobacteraceae bacterium]
MRYAIAIAATLFAVTSASAQAPQIVGTSAFCLKTGSKADCKFPTAAACQKMLKETQTTGSETGSCVPRGDVR